MLIHLLGEKISRLIIRRVVVGFNVKLFPESLHTLPIFEVLIRYRLHQITPSDHTQPEDILILLDLNKQTS